jgi:hypothetical protein
MASIRVDPSEMEWGSAVAFYGPGAVHEGRDIVQMKVLSDRRGEGGGIAWLVRYSVHGHMWVGQNIRTRLSPVAFRRWFVLGLLILGIYLVARSAV